MIKEATNLLNRIEADKEIVKKGTWKEERDALAKCIIKERDVMKIYEIETKKEAVDIMEIIYKYRFVSLYNGARGIWFDNIEDAEKQGQKHQEIIEKLHLHPLYCINSGDIKGEFK